MCTKMATFMHITTVFRLYVHDCPLKNITHEKARDLNVPGSYYFCYKGLKR